MHLIRNLFCAMGSVLIASLLLTVPVTARAQDEPAPGWRVAWDFLVENVCIDANNQPLPGVSPLDEPAACPSQRKLAIGERLPYHKRDWAMIAERDMRPNGYQQSDSFPVRTIYGPAVVQTYDFGDTPRAFGRFDDGDGGQIAFFTAQSASFGITEDGGAGLQLFLGPACKPVDSWIVVDSSFAARPACQTLARLTRLAWLCWLRLDDAFTRWHVQPVSYRDRVHGRLGRVVLSTLVSEHFGGRDVEAADHLERMYFTRELGYTRWERWQNLSRHDRPSDRQGAAMLAAQDRCEPGLGAPAAGAVWVMTDCREWTQMVPPADPAGDSPGFWLDKLRDNAATKATFLP